MADQEAHQSHAMTAEEQHWATQRAELSASFKVLMPELYNFLEDWVVNSFPTPALLGDIEAREAAVTELEADAKRRLADAEENAAQIIARADEAATRKMALIDEVVDDGSGWSILQRLERLDRLELERDDFREEINELREENDNLRQKYHDSCTEREDLRARVRQLEELQDNLHAESPNSDRRKRKRASPAASDLPTGAAGRRTRHDSVRSNGVAASTAAPELFPLSQPYAKTPITTMPSRPMQSTRKGLIAPTTRALSSKTKTKVKQCAPSYTDPKQEFGKSYDDVLDALQVWQPDGNHSPASELEPELKEAFYASLIRFRKDNHYARFVAKSQTARCAQQNTYRCTPDTVEADSEESCHYCIKHGLLCIKTHGHQCTILPRPATGLSRSDPGFWIAPPAHD